MTEDESHIRAALDLAAVLKGRTGVNPTVGCVIVKDGVIVGEGATGEGGRPHAEEVACDAAGERARGATAYVTLEPCAQRSTGAASCSERLVAAGVARVVIAVEDPHPMANGAGLARLKAAGIAVTLGVLRAEAHAMNADFFARH
jgi:pyrimidine deaminase RibD-like protein